MLKRIGLPLTFVLLSAALAPAGAAAAPTAHRIARTSANGLSTRDYWTPQRLRRAAPLSVERPSGPVAPAPALGPAQQPTGQVDLSNVRAGRAPGEIHLGDKPPYKSGQIPLDLQSTFPYSASGRLFGKFGKGGGFYSCSATVVTSGSQSTILTAGHCVFEEQYGYAKRVIFVPAYHNRSRPFGVWNASFEVATPEWEEGNFNYDYAALRLRKNHHGKVGAVVGEEGIAVDQPRDQAFQAVGYPYNLGKTKQMRFCSADFAGVDPRDRQSGKPDNAIGCNMSSGASGGSWTIRDATGVPYVNSVTSFGYGALKNVLFGPYFTKDVFKLVNRASRGR